MLSSKNLWVKPSSDEDRIDLIGQNGNDGLHYDVVNKPSHYTNTKIECIDYLEDILGVEGLKYFCQGNTNKYLHRWRTKNGLQDLEKAQWYLNKLINLEKEHPNGS
jgi:hypothetical protein